MTVHARAKVNLALEVLGRRDDGYHELRSLLWAVDLADRLTLEATAEGIEVECAAPGVPEGPENLAWRAVDLMRREVGGSAGVRIRIDKTIPVAAGLGGGSADGAAVVVGLEHLWEVRLPRARRVALATALGMDVPFFLGRGPAVASGRGEVLRPVARARALSLVVVNPGFPLATRDVYDRLEPGEFTGGARVRALTAALGDGAGAIAGWVFNALEGPAARLWPGLAEVRGALLAAGCLGVVMSGSGPTVVGIAGSRSVAARIQAALGDRPWRTWAVQTVVGPALTLGPASAGRRARRSVPAWGVAKR